VIGISLVIIQHRAGTKFVIKRISIISRVITKEDINLIITDSKLR
jgi:hypothetical protein